MEGALRKKRQIDELYDDLYPMDDLKQGLISEADAENCCNNQPELSQGSYYYCCVLDKDHGSWSSDEGRGSGIRAMAIRKQCYMQDCFSDKSQEEDFERVDLDGGGDVIKELWRAESPLCDGAAQEPLFGDCHFSLEDHTSSFSASAFRFWEEEDDQKSKTMQGKDLDEYEYDEELFAESVELPSL